MKKIVGKDAKIYNYIENVFKTISSYYNYEYIKMLMLDGGKSTQSSVIDYYNDNIKNSFKKYCYVGSNYDSKQERNEFGFLAIDTDTIYQDAEVISMSYRILEELKLEDIIVNIKAYKNYELERLQNYLEQLDVDYEISDSGDLLDTDASMAFEIIMEIKDKRIVLASGYKKSDRINFITCTNYLDNILDVLSVIYEDRDFDVLARVAIIGEAEEERIMGMKLAQDLRWCEIKVDVDTNNINKNEQLDNFKDANFMIVLNKDDLNKGLIKVIDNLTHEETLVDENEIIDYIVSNI